LTYIFVSVSVKSVISIFLNFFQSGVRNWSAGVIRRDIEVFDLQA